MMDVQELRAAVEFLAPLQRVQFEVRPDHGSYVIKCFVGGFIVCHDTERKRAEAVCKYANNLLRRERERLITKAS